MSTKLTTDQTRAALDLLNKLVSSYEPSEDAEANEEQAMEDLMVIWQTLSVENNRREVRDDMKARAQEMHPDASAQQIRDITNKALKIYWENN
jgi:hypothetical protein